MQDIRTGIYQTQIIRKKEELILKRDVLEEKIKEIEETIELRVSENKNREHPLYSTKLNIESLKKIKQTGQLLLDGCSAEKIASYFGLKMSTIESYILHLK
jgi:capsule polysaccharide export protein KpsC/LpsZ